jgi:hypothetical protein
VKSGQSAVEYLITYGWAILAVLVAVGAFAYFGIFNPSDFASEGCLISTPFTCEDYFLSKWETGVNQCEVSYVLRNTNTKEIFIQPYSSNISCQNCLDSELFLL